MNNKRRLLKYCQDQLNEKVSVAKKNMEEAQSSANNETKSSAGDKYETGRAMSQRERDLHARQLSELLNTKKLLSTINAEKQCDTVALGAIVETSTALFFISASLGQIEFEGNQIMAISAISPIAQAMLGKKKGGKFLWMKKKSEIIEIL